MFTDNGLAIDPEALDQVLRKADVLTIGFVAFPERLLIDTRHNQWEGPLVAVAEPVASVQERYHWLGRHRGSFGAPEAFSFFVWPHSVRTLVESGVLNPVRDRLAAVSVDSDHALDITLARFLELEQEAWRSAIRGNERWATVWQRAG